VTDDPSAGRDEALPRSTVGRGDDARAEPVSDAPEVTVDFGGRDYDSTWQSRGAALASLSLLDYSPSEADKSALPLLGAVDGRTPLHAVIGLSQAMKEQIRGPLNERQLHTVGIIEQSGYRLLNLINNILDLAKLETGKLALRYQKFNLHHLGEGCLEAVRRQAEKKQIELRYMLNDHTAELTSDFQRLQQVINHLLTNALKFTEVGGRVELEIRCEAAVSQVVFVVRDTGIGIEAADLPRIFEPFVQLDSSLARQHEGTGLGLGLAAKMAHLLDGELTAVSTPGQGSTFTLILPWK
jgi:signal transduction histidine kinase